MVLMIQRFRRILCKINPTNYLTECDWTSFICMSLFYLIKLNNNFNRYLVNYCCISIYSFWAQFSTFQFVFEWKTVYWINWTKSILFGYSWFVWNCRNFLVCLQNELLYAWRVFISLTSGISLSSQFKVIHL